MTNWLWKQNSWFMALLREVEEARNLNQSKVMEEVLQHQWNADLKNNIRTAGRIFDDDDGSESEEDIEPLIVDF
jgi:hypothetical protein